MKLRCVGGSTAIFVTWKGLGMLKSLFQDDASPNLPVNTTLLSKSTVGFLYCWKKIGVAILQYWAWPTTEAISVSRYVDLQGPLHQRKVLYPKSVFDGDAMMAILFSQSLWFVNMGLRETHGPTKNPFWWSLAITPASDEAHFQAGFSITLPWTRFETALCGPLEACNIRSGLYQWFWQSHWFLNIGLGETHRPTKNPFRWSPAIFLVYPRPPDSDAKTLQRRTCRF